ncbi:MAG: hypothetical protein KC636_32435, partial [Myxococcales bacterium]|nr:hypothetical protein [Myxococcales bacterium]
KAQSLRATAESEWLKALTDDDRATIAGLVAASLRGEHFEVPARVAQGFSVTQSPVFVGLRRGGALVEQQWIMASDQLTAITQGVAAMREKLGDAAARAIETVELCFAHGVFAADLSTKRDRLRLNSNIYRGLRGLWIEHAGQAALISPTVMLEQNAPFTEIEEAFCQGRGLPETALRDGTVKLRGFDSVQLLVRPSEAPPRAVALTRGTRTIHVSEITRARVDEMQRELGDFLVRNVDAEGRMVYSYHPGLGVEEQVTNNMIRQWMATIALSRTARHRDDAEVFAVAERNIRYNLRHFYRASGKLGLIEHQGSVKLGAVALAALALIEHPARQKFARTERRLLATIDHLWMDERGAFRCFYKPDRPADSLNNFYPGEALLTWSFLYQETGDKALLDRFTRAVAHYRAWHLDHRNPAFVPWHTQAYYKVWRATRDPALAEWIFEMNDWLLAMQQWDGVSWRDILGRFYNPNIPKYGPPHASSTGVYMEGLIDAFCMARELGDADRQERYRLALVRGLRSVWQLTYKSDDELFYVKEPARVRGGVRTCVYDNRIRVDNVQHNLMAILKILAAFGEDDYRHP